MEYLAAKLKALRKEKGFTQEEVADFLQVSYQAISKWECENAKENALVTFLDGDDKLQTAQNAIISLVRLIYHHLSSMLHCNKYTDVEQLDLLNRYILICDTLYENDDIQEIIHCKIEAYLKKFYILSGQNEIKQSLAALENVYTLLQKSFLIENSSIPVSPLGKYSEYKSTLNANYKKRWVITSIETNYQKDMSQMDSNECALNSNPSIHPKIMHLLDKIRSLE